VDAWLQQPSVTVPEPTARHLHTMRDWFRRWAPGGNLTSDAHLAALTIEHGAELFSTDNDFGRFMSLRWRNPHGRIGRAKLLPSTARQNDYLARHILAPRLEYGAPDYALLIMTKTKHRSPNYPRLAFDADLKRLARFTNSSVSIQHPEK
jgi:hypothetical protein